MLKEASSHLLIAGRLSGHQTPDLRLALTHCLDEQRLQQFDSMMQRMDIMCAAAHKVRFLTSRMLHMLHFYSWCPVTILAKAALSAASNVAGCVMLLHHHCLSVLH